MSIKSSIRKIKKRFDAGFGLTQLSELTGLIALASKFPGDESGATAQSVMRTQAKLPPERAPVSPSRLG